MRSLLERTNLSLIEYSALNIIFGGSVDELAMNDGFDEVWIGGDRS